MTAAHGGGQQDVDLHLFGEVKVVHTERPGPSPSGLQGPGEPDLLSPPRDPSIVLRFSRNHSSDVIGPYDSDTPTSCPQPQIIIIM